MAKQSPARHKPTKELWSGKRRRAALSLMLLARSPAARGDDGKLLRYLPDGALLQFPNSDSVACLLRFRARCAGARRR
jgi:hypothetical protein